MTDNGGGPFKPIPQEELDKLIERAEAQSRELESPIHNSIGIVPDEEGDGREEIDFEHVRPRVGTPRARQNPAPIPVSHRRSAPPKTYCDLCGHVDAHATGCPATARPPEVVDITQLADQTEPSIRRELRRIAVGILKRVADRLEKK